ncbi:MAG: hypothetical protein ACLFTT_16210 [Candidatus Hydrogenedentota bacterium]
MHTLASVFLAVLAAGVAQPTADEGQDKKVIVNYWTHIQKILESEDVRANRRTMRPSGEVLVRVSYPFDHLMHLKPKHLLRAAHEGVDAARTAAWGRSPEAAHRQAYENVAMALEYYPLLAGNDQDVLDLLYAMARRANDPVLRTFLVNRTVSGLAPDSLFARYLRDEVTAMAPQKFRNYLYKPATAPDEDPMVQMAAIRALYRYDYAYQGRVLMLAPEFQVYARRHDLLPEPAMLLRPGAPEPSGDTARMMSTLETRWLDTAQDLAKHLEPERGRPAAVRALVRETLGRIRQEAPLEEPAAIDDLLAQYPKDGDSDGAS